MGSEMWRPLIIIGVRLEAKCLGQYLSPIST